MEVALVVVRCLRPLIRDLGVVKLDMLSATKGRSTEAHWVRYLSLAETLVYCLFLFFLGGFFLGLHSRNPLFCVCLRCMWRCVFRFMAELESLSWRGVTSRHHISHFDDRS
jgi:hypothetical protein